MKFSYYTIIWNGGTPNQTQAVCKLDILIVFSFPRENSVGLKIDYHCAKEDCCWIWQAENRMKESKDN